jgi:hypothetical protein
MSDGRWVQKILAGIVIGNLVILTLVFLVPRAQFILEHKNLTGNQLMETSGPPDMPNQLSLTYKVAHRIRELSPEDATVFMPPGDRLAGSFRSASIQVLYPRRIHFGKDENFASELKEAKKTDASYFVYSPDWRPEFCKEIPHIELTGFGFGMCRINF